MSGTTSRPCVFYLQKDWWAGLHASTVGANRPSPGDSVVCQLVHPRGKHCNVQLHCCDLTRPKGRHICQGAPTPVMVCCCWQAEEPAGGGGHACQRN